MNRIVKYGLVLLRGKSFLINRKKGTELFLMPGGKPEGKETPEDCLVREIQEEHQCAVVLNSISFVGVFEDLAANEADTIIEIRLYKGDVIGEPKASSEIAEQRWFSSGDDESLLSAIIRNKILPVLIEKELI